MIIGDTAVVPMPDWLGLTTSIAGIIIAIVSFILSILFYRWATSQANQITAATTEIAKSTLKLESIFSELNKGTFSLLKGELDAKNTLLSQLSTIGSPPTSDVMNRIDIVKLIMSAEQISIKELNTKCNPHELIDVIELLKVSGNIKVENDKIIRIKSTKESEGHKTDTLP